MGRIKKLANPKHEATISPFFADLTRKAAQVPLVDLPSTLATLPAVWSFPRGDLYHWINVLNRFDDILALVIDRYDLKRGPQKTPFGRSVLKESWHHDFPNTTLSDQQLDAELDSRGYGPEGDRELVEAILRFSLILLEKCGNRSLYSSSDRLDDLLNTTSNSLLRQTLRVALALAQRYHARQRHAASSQSLLSAHYNINLDKLQKLAAPFPRPNAVSRQPLASPSPAVLSRSHEAAPPTKHNANDMITLLRESDEWEEWGSVRAVYYPSGAATTEQARPAPDSPAHEPATSHTPSTPTPLRRSATLPTPRQRRASGAEDLPTSQFTTPVSKPEEAPRGSKVVTIPVSRVASSSLTDLTASTIPNVPNESEYDFLHRLRVAHSLVKSDATREEILDIRILAIANLAYVHSEANFQQKVLQQDADQPKRLQLVYQLAELAHLGASGDIRASRLTQTLALNALEALARQKSRAADVCAALNVNVNHGVLMFLTRKAITEVSKEEDEPTESEEWRDALFALLRTLPSSGSRTPETLVAAGLMSMFVDILNQRTEKARRMFPRVLEFLDTFVHAVRDALGTLASARGFDAVSELIGHETKSALENVHQGRGLPAEFRTPSVDYEIAYFQQQSLRWLFRFVNHIMQHSGGGFDRLLRNLIDSPPLLTALRLVYENANVFGSHVWSGAVNILSSFIHNEPTSYAVIAEAGLSKSLLESVATRDLSVPPLPEPIETDEAAAQAQPVPAPSEQPAAPPRVYYLTRSPDQKLAGGILPASEAMSSIPQAFGAICLNTSGMELFQSSGALDTYFEIFESPAHVKCMKDDSTLVRSLGTTFDELVRHHPALKPSVMSAVIVMVARVGLLCKRMAWTAGAGTRLWRRSDDGNGLEPVGPKSSWLTDIGVPFDKAVESGGAFSYPHLQDATLPNGGKMALGDVSNLPDPENLPLDANGRDQWGLGVDDYMYPVVRFLGAFFENQTNCTQFIEAGGVEFVLDFATLPSLPHNFRVSKALVEFVQLVHMMTETKPQLVLPSLVQRTQDVVDCLSDFWREPSPNGFFTSLTKPESDTAARDSPTAQLATTKGTYLAQHLVAAYVLTGLLHEVYTPPMYQTRPSQQTSAFSQVNLAERYSAIVTSLGKLHAACVWEDIALQKNIPKRWVEATEVRQDKQGTDDSRNVSGHRDHAGSGHRAAEGDRPGTADGAQGGDDGQGQIDTTVQNDPAFRNVEKLRYILTTLPSFITRFFNSLGHGVIGKRRIETYQRQNASMVADAIADAMLHQLQLEVANQAADIQDKFSYLIFILSSLSQLLFETPAERTLSECPTLLLLAFKKKGGFKVLRDFSQIFVDVINQLVSSPSQALGDSEGSARIASAYGGLRIILTCFAEIASPTYVVESNQTQALASPERERDRPDYFHPSQFLVDLRMEIVPMVRELWNSPFVDKASTVIVKCMVDILRSVLEGDREAGAARRSDPPQYVNDIPRKTFTIYRDRLATLRDRGYDQDLAREALYRCNNALTAAEEYCKARSWIRPPPRCPPPSQDLDPVRGAGSGEASEETPSGDTPSDRAASLARFLAQASAARSAEEGAESSEGGTQNADGENRIDIVARALNHILADTEGRGNDSNQGSSSDTQSQQRRRQVAATIDDLDSERDAIRENLIERCLDVLNVHHDVTFELSDLIQAAMRRHHDIDGFRREVGETLIQSLVSLQMEENFRSSGKKIAAYANLLALVIQDESNFRATLGDLKDYFVTLLGFIKITPSDKDTDETAPWIAHVLLVLERLLSDDAQPPQIRWNPPPLDGSESNEEPAQLEEPLLSLDDKTKLFDALLEILPRIGRDTTLALSVCRILAVLTRSRSIAVRMGEKRNLQRLFVMMKQVCGSMDEKLQSSFMLILRHVIEDEETIRQIMRSEIVAHFESRTARQTETSNYVRHMYHLVLRAPELFVEVTNEKLKIQRYDPHQRPQVLTLKTTEKNESSTESKDSAEQPRESVEGGQPSDGKEKGKTTELKPPVVENPDGVIHYLLSELLSYKDVDDKEPPQENTDVSSTDPSGSRMDVDVPSEEASSASSTADGAARGQKKSDKPSFKPEDHPIYIYRCFLLQCLTELLASYNRTKVEFINFSRKADPLATTPSKPRGGVLNYLLNALVPVGTLEHEESLAFKKRSNVSSLAINVLVALCTKTGEFGALNRRRSHEDEEDEPALTFVRRFTLEHALKAYKDAMASTEPLDVKYSRLMCLAMLFDKMLGHSIFGGDNNNNNNNFDSWNFESTTRQMAKTMFEKHFISALTSSIADIDLNFPSARRVIKYILRPLNKLTQTAVYLSETSSITLPEEADEDKISSATSVSDLDDDREETPDLFRHSTLGMLEPRHDEEETSEEEESEEDDEMYDDEYGDEMDYDEEMPEDDGEVVSEEDEDLDGPIEGLPGDSGMDIEVLIDDDGEHDEEDDEDDEDDDDDEGDDEDDMHDDEEDEIMAGEITGDHDNDSLAEDREDEWESEDMSGDNEEAEMLTQFEDELADIRQADRDGDSQRFDDLLRVINEASGGDVFRVTNMDDNAPDDVDDDEGNEDEDEEDEMDEIEEDMDDMDDDRGSYDGFDEEDIEPWGGWDGDEPPLPGHQRFRAGTAWGVPGMSGRGGIVAGQPYRLHRSQINSRPSDVGTNPLLIRSNRQTEGQTQTRASGNEIFTDWISGLNPANTASWIPFQSPASFVNAVMQAIDAQRGPGFDVITRDGLQVHVDRRALQPGLRFQDLFGMPQQAPSRPRDDPTQAIGFTLAPTATRWREEASLLFGNSYVEKTQRVVNSILRLLVPPAIEEEKRRQKELEEERKRREEERAERERLERIAREEEERERKRKEEEEAARRREERERHAEARGEEADEHMEDVSGPAEGTTAPAEAGPAEPPRRIHTTIRGRQVDITGMEIDPEYLEALPEELREEVIMQQVAEQRSQAFAAGEEPTEIDQEFLDALPPELREEMLQQEAADRRRREREAARRQAAANGGPVAEEMDTASFLATLDPQLRQVVLADQSEEVLATLDPALRREALALQPGRRLAQAGDTSGRLDQRQREESQDTDAKKPQRRQIIQMLDKAGVATLLRLMFMPLQGNARHQLHDILHNVCENRQNRMEVINLLLSILQDGSTDVSAVERSFAHLSLRAKTPPAQKTPQSAKRPLPSSTSMSANSEITPLMVVQQCLGTLSFLTQYNPHISWFFLTEHESASALKLKALRKGKGKEKETRANRFALNALLSLLDRKLVMESPTCMEQLASLLSTITQPLTLLLRREKERQEAENKGKEPIRPEGEESTEEPAQTAAPSGQDSEMTEAAPPTQEEAAGETSEQPKAEDDKNKKRTIEPPVVPDYNLQLVVRILAARECNGKTFRDTLSAINNLSAIPRAKDVIGRELISQAQGLSEAILLDLEELIPHVQQAKTGTDMQGLALAKFSPPSSDQAKLLRVLTALDYLFDPSRVEKLKGAEPESAPKEDMLRTLYESATFGPLWSKLSECLTVVRQKENMLNVATTLLPLIEALMVVCKNTPLKDAPVSRRGREGSVSSPPQESGGVGSNMERLFFSFTEEHRKILNELVRQNPRLMSGTFSLLVKNPKVLEFDNKRNYFTRRLHMRGAEARHSHPPLQLSVRRDQVFLDSFKSLYFKTADEVKYGKLNVRFHGEEGIDAGGVTREWFQVLARGMFNPNYALFIPVASDRTTFHPNRLSGVNSEHLMFFKFIGRIIGKALYEGRVLDCHFSRAVYKSILGKPVSIKDMETLDLDYYKSLVWMLENDITDIITETFAIETDDFGEKQIIDLIPNGRNIPVTQENKEEYVQRVVEYKLVGSVKEQLEHFLKGFHDIIPADLISIFNEQELELLISGLPEIDVDDWRNNTEYHNYSPSSPQIQWFWRAVRSFDKEERAKLLQFVTGTSKVPLNGFKELEGMNGFSKFNIHRDYGDKDRLPSSHTCFNQLDLPEYESYEELRSRLYTAMTQGSEYFGFA